MKQMTISVLSAASMLLAGAQAERMPESEAFIVGVVDELKSAADTHGDASPEVRQVLEDNLATEAIGRFLLAGDAAESATDDQRTRYDTLFPRFIAAAFAEEIGQLTSRRIDVTSSLERRPGDIIVQSALFDDKDVKRANIDWRVRILETGENKLIDVLVERISQLTIRRQTFSSIVDEEGVEGLLAYMETTIGEAGVASLTEPLGSDAAVAGGAE
ncbi:MAG: ABC transporter substrate-binding protein [Pseudomonadota bacterium]